MSDLRIEPTHRVQARRCPCCGKGVTSVRGQVYRGLAPYATYCAALYLRHPDRKAVVTLALDHEGPVAAALTARHGDDGVRVDLADLLERGVREMVGLDPGLTPDDRLRGGLKDELFRVADEVCDGDPVLRAFLLTA